MQSGPPAATKKDSPCPPCVSGFNTECTEHLSELSVETSFLDHKRTQRHQWHEHKSSRGTKKATVSATERHELYQRSMSAATAKCRRLMSLSIRQRTENQWPLTTDQGRSSHHIR